MNRIINTILIIEMGKTYDVPKAANVPFGISVDGARKSPLILIPDKTPVIVGKNIPNIRNQVYPSEYCAQKLDTKFSELHPMKPWVGSSPIKLPTIKLSPANNNASSSKNCNLMTHLTPATLITPSKSTALVANPRIAHLLFPNPTNPAIDSPKPVFCSKNCWKLNNLFVFSFGIFNIAI